MPDPSEENTEPAVLPASNALVDKAELRDKGCLGQIRLLRWVLLLALGFTMLLTLPLWLQRRSFPLLPLLKDVSLFPAPWDWVPLGISIAALLIGIRYPKPAILIFFLTSVVLAIEDQNRLQPWFYLYSILLLFTIMPAPAGFVGARLVVSAVYFWAGAQKLNPMFFKEVAPLFASQVNRLLPSSAAPVGTWLIYCAPAIEIFIAVAVWIPVLRRSAILLSFAMHAMSLYVLGPWGVQFNRVVWPWNIVMPLLLVLLFSGGPFPGIWRSFLRYWPAPLLAAFFCLTPILSFRDWWDSYPSWRLYSGNTPRASILLSNRTTESLPDEIKKFASPAAPGQHQNWRGPYVLDFRNWAEAEMGVPPLPEIRSYRRIAEYLAQWRERPGDVRLILEPRGQRAHIEEPPAGK
jgi:hypothetical protein